MWFKKKKDDFGFTQEQQEEANKKNAERELVKRMIGDISGEKDTEFCAECGCIVKKEHMKIVQATTVATFMFQVYAKLGKTPRDVNSYIPELYYCTRCAPAYDRVFTVWDEESEKEIKTFSRRVPEHYVSVTEEGKEIKKS